MGKTVGTTEDRAADEVVTSVRLSRDLLDSLRAVARRENRTVAGQLRHAIEQMTADADPDEKAQAA
jgi:predicted DNA-binding protein